MKLEKAKALGLTVARGYGRLGLYALGFLAVLAAALALSTAWVYPLWLMATRHKAAYNYLVIGLFILACLFFVVVSLRAQLLSGNTLWGLLRLFGSRLLKLVLAFAWLASLFFAVACLFRSLFLPAFALFLAFIALAGFLFFAPARPK